MWGKSIAFEYYNSLQLSELCGLLTLTFKCIKNKEYS